MGRHASSVCRSRWRGKQAPCRSAICSCLRFQVPKLHQGVMSKVSGFKVQDVNVECHCSVPPGGFGERSLFSPLWVSFALWAQILPFPTGVFFSRREFPPERGGGVFCQQETLRQAANPPGWGSTEKSCGSAFFRPAPRTPPPTGVFKETTETPFAVRFFQFAQRMRNISGTLEGNIQLKTNPKSN